MGENPVFVIYKTIEIIWKLVEFCVKKNPNLEAIAT